MSEALQRVQFKLTERQACLVAEQGQEWVRALLDKQIARLEAGPVWMTVSVERGSLGRGLELVVYGRNKKEEFTRLYERKSRGETLKAWKDLAAEGMAWAREHGADVIRMEYTGPREPDGTFPHKVNRLIEREAEFFRYSETWRASRRPG